jgi:glutamate synthase (NADPH/NADH) large chain
MKHAFAFSPVTESETELDVGGKYHYRARGEYHLLNPHTIARSSTAVRFNSHETYQEFAEHINNQNRHLCTLRGLLEFRKADKPLPLEEVEPASEIVKRFATGAMSFGSISKEAHETLAIAMNRIGAQSRTRARAARTRSATSRCRTASAAPPSSRWLGALRRDDQLPGERRRAPDQDRAGRQARRGRPVARAQGGRGDRARAPLDPRRRLISPPPHHDIYSIEDLAQLIYDLKNVNPKARISVKLVSEVGVGTWRRAWPRPTPTWC